MKPSRTLVFVLAACAACAGAGDRPVGLAIAPSPSSTASVTSVTTASPSGSTATVPESPPPASFEVEDRQLLDEMVAVDTSHGGETKLLEPIAERYRRAGVPVQILESSPGRGNLIARLKGSGAKRPLLLIAHVDVVPVDGQPWTVPAFKTTEKDGFLWGRGINDDKGMAAAIVAITLEMARTKAPLTRDVIVALTAGEETGGFAGARWLAENHKQLIDAEIALNEGGSVHIADDMSKALDIALCVSEKVFQTYRLVVRGKGGHSSRPPTSGDPVVALARALVKIGDVRFPARVLPEVRASFELGLTRAEKKYEVALRHAIASAPKIAPADDKVLSELAGYNAVLRTTCVTTMLQASPQDNVLPTTAEATVNCRILPGDTRAQAQAALTLAIGDPNVELIVGPSYGDSAGSPFDGEVIDAVKKVAAATFPGIPVVPSMTPGATDSRYLRGIGIRTYGVSPSTYTTAEARAAHNAHGPDERTPTSWLAPSARYFRDVVRTLVL